MKLVKQFFLVFASMVLIVGCNNNSTDSNDSKSTLMKLKDKLTNKTEAGNSTEEETPWQEEEQSSATSIIMEYMSTIDLSGVKNMNTLELAKNLNTAINANCYDDAKIRIPETPYFVQLTKRIVTNPNHWEIMNLCTMARYESMPMKIGTTTEIYSSACEADGGYSYKVLFNSSYDELFDMEIIIYNGTAVGMEPDSAIYRWSNIEKQGL